MTVQTYPPTRVPLRPVLSGAELGVSAGARPNPCPSVLQAGAYALVTSGRVAVALALKELNLPPESEVLIPAFHCSSMVEPVVWAGAKPIFFRIAPDGTVDLDDVKRKLRPATRALLVAHYFGFHQEMPAIRDFCDRHAIALIEDCAHAFFGNVYGRPVGSYGDYACASPWKFFCAYDGGCLISARHSLQSVRLGSAGWRYEIKSIVNAFEQSFAYGRLPAAGFVLRGPLRAKDAMRRWMKNQRNKPEPEIGPSALDGGFAFEPAWIDKRMSRMSQKIIRMAPQHSIVADRRRNFLALLTALADLPGAQPFHRELPDGVVPHMFPMLVNAPDAAFTLLRQRGVPMLRFGEWLWPGVDESVCETSLALSRHLCQFPCHQGLSGEEIEWLARQIREVLQQVHSNGIRR